MISMYVRSYSVFSMHVPAVSSMSVHTVFSLSVSTLISLSVSTLSSISVTKCVFNVCSYSVFKDIFTKLLMSNLIMYKMSELTMSTKYIFTMFSKSVMSFMSFYANIVI